MSQADELEVQIIGLRERYDAVVERRIEHLQMTGYFETSAPDACDNPDYEMEALEDWIGELKVRLMELKPEQYVFGKKLKSSSQLQLGREFSQKGDEGFFICLKCRGLFECGPQYKEKKLSGNQRESFKTCEEHKGRKSVGTMILKAEDLAI